LVVEGLVPVELKSIEMLLPIHRKQLLSQLRLTNLPVGLLINFNVERLVDGVKRVVNPKYKPESVDIVPVAGPQDPGAEPWCARPTNLTPFPSVAFVASCEDPFPPAVFVERRYSSAVAHAAATPRHATNQGTMASERGYDTRSRGYH
jgi:hypothetical protein